MKSLDVSGVWELLARAIDWKSTGSVLSFVSRSRSESLLTNEKNDPHASDQSSYLTKSTSRER